MNPSRYRLPSLLTATLAGALMLTFRVATLEEGAGFGELPDQPGEAIRFYVHRHAGDPNGVIPTEHILRERGRILKPGAMAKSTSVTWNEAGPDNIGGRTRGLLIDSSTTSTMYAASVGGGVWKTTNTGTSWSSTTDNLGNIAFCCLAFAPGGSTAARTIYAGTGEGFFNIDAIRGAGLYKSTNSGTSWSQVATGAAMSYYINRIAVSKRNANYVFVATNSGLFRSTNGGTSFAEIGTFTTEVQDLALDPGGDDTLYVSAYSNGVYKSTNATATTPTFTQVRTHTGVTRTEIVMAPSNPSVLYACFANSSYEPGWIERTRDKGSNWIAGTIPTNTDGALSSYMNTQGWYDNTIAVNPSSDSLIYVGGVDSYKSTNGGGTWTKMTSWQNLSAPYAHADIHDMVFETASIFYIVCDGGIFRTTDGGGTWNDVNNGYNVTQFYYGSLAGSGTTYLAGTQDNGTLKSTGGASWTAVHGGDGGASLISHSNSSKMFCAYVRGALYYSTNGGSSWSTKSPPSSGGSSYLFIAPAEMSPSNDSIVFTGGNNFYRTVNYGTNWTNLYTIPSVSTNGQVSAIATSVSDDTLLFGTSKGKLYRSTNAGTAWAAVGPSGPTYITDVEIAFTNANIAWATNSGYGSGGHVYKTTNLGAASPTWTDVTGSLPALPAMSICIDRYDPNHVLIGGDAGIYETTNGGTSWATANTGFAAAASVEDIDIRYDGLMLACTHGRGAFASISALPVELQSFTAVRRGNAVSLRWRTVSEQNSLEYRVQRLDNGVWRELATIPAAGYSSVTRAYAWVDADAPAGTVRYRLLQRDRDGTTKLLPEREVGASSQPLTPALTVFPNPAASAQRITLRCDIDADAASSVEICDLSGRAVHSADLGYLTEGEHTVSLSLPSLRPGVYYVSLRSGSRNMVTKLAVMK